MDKPLTNLLISETKKIQRRKVGFFPKLGRNLSLLNTYRFSQIYCRLKNILRNKARGGVYSKQEIGECSLDSKAIPKLSKIVQGRSNQWASQWSQEIQSAFRGGEVKLLNNSVSLGSDFNWECKNVRWSSHLWRFQLHYQEFLLRSICWSQKLADEKERDSTQQVVWSVLDRWLDYYDTKKRKPKGDPWHPYVISRRIPVWCQLLTISSIGEGRRQRLLNTVVENTEFLQANFEWDLCGNHLLENYRALGYSIAVLEHPWSGENETSFFKGLKRQVEYQLLHSGEHYERSPMYHCQVAGILLELGLLFQDRNGEVHDYCLEKASSMMAFLDQIVHPDGEIPLFNDAVFQEAPSVQTLENWFEANSGEPKSQLSDQDNVSDYWICGENGDRLIVDCGSVSAHDLPAHGHCDLTNFEWSHKGERWITDSGVLDYSGEAEHFYCRSSIAHNVFTLNRENCCEIWGKFRMGRRGMIVSRADGKSSDGGYRWTLVSHDGYGPLGYQFYRGLIYRNDGAFCIIDHAKSIKDTKSLPRFGYLHFDPKVEIEKIGSASYAASRNDSEVEVKVSGSVDSFLKEGIYCPEFGLRKFRTVLEFCQTDEEFPVVVSITPKTSQPIEPEVRKTGGQVFVQFDGIDWTF